MPLEDSDMKIIEARLSEKYFMIRREVVKIWIAASTFALAMLGAGGYMGALSLTKQAAAKYLESGAGLEAKARIDAIVKDGQSALERANRTASSVETSKGEIDRQMLRLRSEIAKREELEQQLQHLKGEVLKTTSFSERISALERKPSASSSLTERLLAVERGLRDTSWTLNLISDMGSQTRLGMLRLAGITIGFSSILRPWTKQSGRMRQSKHIVYSISGFVLLRAFGE
jgi:hypothetical protein